MHPLQRLFSFARPYRRAATLGTIYSILNKFFDVLPELLIGVAVDVVVNKRASFLAGLGLVEPMHQLYALVALTIAVWVFESLFEYLYALKWRGLAQDLQHTLRNAAYAHLQALPPDTIARERSGRLMALMNEDVNQIERFLNTGANDLIQVFCSSLMVGAVFFFLTSTLAVLALLPIPLILLGAFWFQRRLYPRYAAAREAAATVSSRLNNNLAGMATIQAYTAEAFEAEHVRAASDDFRARNADAIRVSAAITPVIRMAVLAGFVATLLYGGWLALNGRLGVGSYSALVYLTQRLLWPLTRLADMTDLYQRAMASVNRVMDLLETKLPLRGTQQLTQHAKGALSFEKIAFAYDGRPAVSDISLAIPAGQTIALVGGTGGGKSTLLKLLLRFIDPDHGRILLDGIDIAALDPAALRRVIGYVAQDPFLTDGSVADNIAYGEHAPDIAKVEAAARAAEAHDFIAALPQGYASAVGERGAQLSGGQRQRIALARAIYRDPAVLVLDEATSAVDNETEAGIQRSLARISHQRTTLIVAHRLSTVRQADAIHVLDAGRIVESGRHDELIARNGFYAALWRLQTGETS
ncbi:MAG TPA: ABC transporter ATP-binding protein [Arenimonas sp.]|uniref:ABC transporter ATP-binding protein n=1 Tax=Arenimonas sp. TaxID=1872635 RepID=UPI002BB6D9AD|nr:ABC transporter ATP-binding protein [Arenimonas sp.]HMB55881.1 ABC transporter ATP-binding protein [Arenimonas sp.]